jgi:hypothetical protein
LLTSAQFAIGIWENEKRAMLSSKALFSYKFKHCSDAIYQFNLTFTLKSV